MKKFILTGVLFFVLGTIATLLVFLAINSYLLPLDSNNVKVNISEKIKDSIDSALSKSADTLASSTLNIPDEGLPLNGFSLEGVQKKALEASGIDTETFVISKEMLVCAEKAVGADRIAAFVSGESPTVLEMGKMSPCLKAQ